MRFLLSTLLLATMLVVIFINPLWLGRVVHSALVVLLFVLGALTWYVTVRVPARMAAAFLQQEVTFCRFGATGQEIGQTNQWGSLVATETELLFLSRKAKGLEIVFRLERSQITAQTPHTVGRKKGLLLVTAEEEHWVYSARPAVLAARLQ